MGKQVFGIVFLISFLVIFNSQTTFALPFPFHDEFSTDPESNGWTESIIGGTGSIEPIDHHGKEVIFKKTSDATSGSALFSITGTFSTVGFENIQLSLIAHQSGSNYEPVDYLEISIDTNNDGDFDSVLKDVDVWEGIDDDDEDGTSGNTTPTSTGFIHLSNAAANNPNLKIKIEARFNSNNSLEDYYLTDFEIIGDVIPNSNVIGGDILEIDNYALLVTAIGINPIITSLFGLTLVGIGLVITRKKTFLGRLAK